MEIIGVIPEPTITLRRTNGGPTATCRLTFYDLALVTGELLTVDAAEILEHLAAHLDVSWLHREKSVQRL